jgi:hypothetical protein
MSAALEASHAISEKVSFPFLARTKEIGKVERGFELVLPCVGIDVCGRKGRGKERRAGRCLAIRKLAP